MAGIGFELRKLFGKKTLLSRTWGVLYASMVSVGSSLVFILLLFWIRYFMRQAGVSELESLFFTSSFTYAFLTAILISAFLNTIVSRYVSDMVFEGRENEICASVFGVLTISSTAAAVIAACLCLGMYLQDGIELSFLAAYYLLTILAADVYNLISYVTALKEYRKVALYYLTGILVTAGVFGLLHRGMGISFMLAVYWALTAGFFVILLLLVSACIKMFGMPEKSYFAFVSYFRKYPSLLLSGCAYMAGFYISNLIYWQFSDMSVQVSIFKTAPNYDMAMFLAMVINLSGMVIFQVKTETTFYEKYIAYLSAVQQGTYEFMEAGRVSLQNTISLQLFFLYEVQLIISIILICLANIFYPYLGVASEILNLLMLLGMGLYGTFCMYATVIFLYYFEDYKAAAVSTVVFLTVTALGSAICCIVGEPYYPLPVLAGSMAGWVVSFLCLRYRLHHLNAYLLCK